MILGISLGVPLILVITLQDRKTLFCVFFLFQGPIRTIDRRFFEDQYFQIWRYEALESRKRNHEEGKARGGAPHPPGRTTWSIGPTRGRLVPSFILTAAYHEKTYAIIFPEFIEAAAEAKVLSYSGRGQILLLRGLRRGGNSSPHHQHSS